MGQVEAVDRFEEPAKAFLEQIRVGDSPLAEPLGDVGDQPHVGQGQLASKLGIAVEDRPEPRFGRAVTGIKRRDVMGERLGIVGPSGPLVTGDLGQGIGQLPFALAQFLEQLTFFTRAQHLSVGAVHVGSKPVRVVISPSREHGTFPSLFSS